MKVYNANDQILINFFPFQRGILIFKIILQSIIYENRNCGDKRGQFCPHSIRGMPHLSGNGEGEGKTAGGHHQCYRQSLNRNNSKRLKVRGVSSKTPDGMERAWNCRRQQIM